MVELLRSLSLFFKPTVVQHPGIRKQRLTQSLGDFQVRFDEEIVTFDNLEEAYQFFKQLDVPATLWDMKPIPYVIGTKEGIPIT